MSIGTVSHDLVKKGFVPVGQFSFHLKDGCIDAAIAVLKYTIGERGVSTMIPESDLV